VAPWSPTAPVPPGCSCEDEDDWDEEEPEDEDEGDEDEEDEIGWGDEPSDEPGWSVTAYAPRIAVAWHRAPAVR
jgi:hypothetical protein